MELTRALREAWSFVGKGAELALVHAGFRGLPARVIGRQFDPWGNAHVWASWTVEDYYGPSITFKTMTPPPGLKDSLSISTDAYGHPFAVNHGYAVKALSNPAAPLPDPSPWFPPVPPGSVAWVPPVLHPWLPVMKACMETDPVRPGLAGLHALDGLFWAGTESLMAVWDAWEGISAVGTWSIPPEVLDGLESLVGYLVHLGPDYGMLSSPDRVRMWTRRQPPLTKKIPAMVPPISISSPAEGLLNFAAARAALAARKKQDRASVAVLFLPECLSLHFADGEVCKVGSSSSSLTPAPKQAVIDGDRLLRVLRAWPPSAPISCRLREDGTVTLEEASSTVSVGPGCFFTRFWPMLPIEEKST